MKTQEKLKKTVQDILSLANIKINGNRPWDIQVHNPDLYARILSKGSLGLGESYMDGWWDCKNLDQFFDRILSNNLHKKIKPINAMFDVLKWKIINLQSKKRAFEVGKKHYDISNELYKNMLDKRLTYTCGYWNKAKNLDKAQKAKLDLVCKKIGLKEGQKVLDIGGGWGSFAKYAAEKYKARVVAITISKEQVELGKEICKNLPEIEIRLQDYRDLVKNGKAIEKFDHVISLGMFEHVGVKNYKKYMKIIEKVLKPKGIFLLHTIGNDARHGSESLWVDKYIFPNGSLPSAKQITEASEEIFRMEDWHNFGADYDKTLMVWYENFTKNWPNLKKDYDERFYRMWKYYLLSLAGSFRSRYNHLWQIVFSKGGVPGGYESIR